MDPQRAEYLMNVARREQQKAFARWNRMASHTSERLSEQARLDCAAWARCADELYAIVEKDYAQKQASKR